MTAESRHSIDRALPPRGFTSVLPSAGSHELLTKETERALAEALVRSRTDLWHALVGYGPLVAPILELVGRAAADGDAYAERDERGAGEALVATLVRIDRDLGLSTAIASDLDFAASHGGSCRRLGVCVEPSDPAFLAYREAVRSVLARTIAARNRFVCANLRLVITIVQRGPAGGMSLEDRIQEGNLGLMRAIDRFDPTLGFRFSTYAAYWIRHALTRALTERARLVRVPAHLHTLLWKCSRVEARTLARSGRPPTLQELASELGEPEGKIQWARQVLRASTIDLDAPAHAGGGRTAADTLVDEHTPDVERYLDDRRHTAVTRDAFCSLSPVERRILIHRYGLANARTQSLSTIGARVGVSRERIRQLQNRALRKLRAQVEASRCATSSIDEPYRRRKQG